MARPLQRIRDSGPVIRESRGKGKRGERLDDWIVTVGFAFRGAEEVVAVDVERGVIGRYAILALSVRCEEICVIVGFVVS